MLVMRDVQYFVNRHWFHRCHVSLVFMVFVVSVCVVLAHEEFVVLVGVVVTVASTLLFASASTFKKRYLGHES
ncbi:hypothetical protein FDE71_22655 [Vibrio parahaemolyticus]|nr:hypothetical protein [Vibrio parahaemolyticus]